MIDHALALIARLAASTFMTGVYAGFILGGALPNPARAAWLWLASEWVQLKKQHHL